MQNINYWMQLRQIMCCYNTNSMHLCGYELTYVTVEKITACSGEYSTTRRWGRDYADLPLATAQFGCSASH